MKAAQYIWLGLMWCLMGVMASCTDSNFTIEAQIDGTPDRTVTIAYAGDQGLITQHVMLEQGNQFTFKGDSDYYTLLWIWDSRGQLIAQMVVRDGDRLTVKSDGLQLPTLDIKGNEPTQQWMKWRKDNLSVLLASDARGVNQLVEQQVKQHPDQLLSTILLVAEYTQLDEGDKVKQLLQTLKPEVRPQRLVNTLEYLLEQNKQPTGAVTQLTLYRHGKGFDELMLRGKPCALLFWSRTDNNRGAAIDSLRGIARSQGTDINVADILVDADTIQWSRTIGKDATQWAHWWAPGGIMDPMLQSMPITRTPLLVITDSTAHIVRTATF